MGVFVAELEGTELVGNAREDGYVLFWCSSTGGSSVACKSWLLGAFKVGSRKLGELIGGGEAVVSLLGYPTLVTGKYSESYSVRVRKECFVDSLDDDAAAAHLQRYHADAKYTRRAEELVPELASSWHVL